jgi:hypothetical protein
LYRISVIAVLTLLASVAVADDTLWTRIYAGESVAMDQGIAVAAAGNEVFVAGLEQEMTPNILLIRYHSNGDLAWARAHDLDTMEFVTGIVIGNDTSPVVCARLQNGPNPSLLLVKFTKDGDTVWTRRRAGMQPTAITRDGSGAVFVWGSLMGATPSETLSLLKYGSDGTLAWQKALRFRDVNQSAGATAVSDGVFAAATAMDTTGARQVLVKFNTSGDTAWTRGLDTLNGTVPLGMASDLTGGVYLSAMRGAQTMVAHFLTGGNLDWLQSVDVQQTPQGLDLTDADPSGRAVLAGSGVNQQLKVVTLTPGGSVYSTSFGPESLPLNVSGVAADADGHPVVVGSTQTPPPSCITVKLAGSAAVEETPAGPLRPTAGAAKVLTAGVMLSVNVAVAGNYTVTLLDVKGGVVKRVYDGFLSAGEHRFAAGALAAGSYFLRTAGKSGDVESRLAQVK